MAITLQQAPISNSGTAGTTVTKTFVSSCTVGSTLIAVVWVNGDAAGTATCDDPTNGSWTAVLGPIRQASLSNTAAYVFVLNNNAASTALTVTATQNSSGKQKILEIWEVTGLSTSAFDVGGSATGNSTNPAATTTGVTAAINEFFLAVYSCSAVAGYAVPSGYTSGQNIDIANFERTAYQISTAGPSTAAITATFTMTSAHQWLAMIATFKTSTAAAGSLFRSVMGNLDGLGTPGKFFSSPI